MAQQPKPKHPGGEVADQVPSRRHFLSGGMMLAGSAIVGSNPAVARGAHAYGSDLIKVGLIGCGRRGTAAAIEVLNTTGAIKIVSMADVFANNLHTAYRGIKGKHPGKLDVQDRRFVGLDSYSCVMQSDADVVILATPPGFRPLQFEAAIRAGKHVFMEKPLAVDAPGVRRVLAAAETAQTAGLAVAVGLQRRHQPQYQECIGRLQDGAIGEPIVARAYWNSSATSMRPRQKQQSELEYQLRNWCHFSWLGGDQINEQHIHNLDVINWLLDADPVEAQGQGGRSWQHELTGQTFDHHMVEFTYARGTKLLSQCRQQRGCWNGVGEHVHGTKGSADISKAKIFDAQGGLIWRSDTTESDRQSRQQEQDGFLAALRRGERPNETDYGARSTMTAIMGRMATYSGKIVRWDDAVSDSVCLADCDRLRCLDDAPPIQPNDRGHYPAPIPGSAT